MPGGRKLGGYWSKIRDKLDGEGEHGRRNRSRDAGSVAPSSRDTGRVDSGRYAGRGLKRKSEDFNTSSSQVANKDSPKVKIPRTRITGPETSTSVSTPSSFTVNTNKLDQEFYGNQLRRAVRNGDTKVVRRLIKGGTSVSTKSWYDVTLLHEMVAMGNLDMVKLLVELGADLEARSQGGRTSLHMACRQKNKPMVSYLLSAKANPDTQTEDGRSCLHIAVWRNDLELVKIFLEICSSINTVDDDGSTPLHNAVKYANPQIVELLLTHGANVNARDKKRQSPLQSCLGNKVFSEHILELLFYYGADCNHHSKGGICPPLSRQEPSCTTHLVTILLRPILRGQAAGHAFPRTLHLKGRASPDKLEDKPLPALMHLCRECIRKSIVNLHHGHCFIEAIKQLPLPSAIVDYILYTNFKWSHIHIS